MSTERHSRVVRLFISSTFRDFMGERDLLVRKVFPELRRKCRERRVELVDVDLRWGITEAEAEQGKVLPVCLAEIDRARPYFMGFIGERYGWVPAEHQYDPSLLQEQPWLAEHRGGKSVTELEILHGVLNNPAMAGRACFYFRDAAYAHAKGGDYAAESPEHAAKLAVLKDRIRASDFPVLENYATPEALAEQVQQDLWQLIEEEYPAEDVPDALAFERQRHAAYGAARLGLYLGGDDYLAALREADQAEEPLVLIRGASGGGKSALLANWLERYRREHPETHLFVHHLGATNDAAEPTKLMRRWIEEMARVLGEKAELPTDAEKLPEELSLWLAKATCQGRWLVVLDALDKLRSGRDLRWLPTFLPAGIRLVASCVDGDVLTAAQARLAWSRELAVQPLMEAQQRELMQTYLGRYRKRLTAGQETLVLKHPLSGNPLFLRTVLEELRVFGVHEELEARIHTLLGPPASKAAGEEPTVDAVFEHVLERVEGDTTEEAVRQTMTAIWASRAGLPQDELLAMTGLAPAEWAAVQLGLEALLLESGGRWTFAHDYARKAVQDRYLPTEESQQGAHSTVGLYFTRLLLEDGLASDRVAEEMPWQWEQAGEREELKSWLKHITLYPVLLERDQDELLGYWVRLGADINAEYEEAWDEWPSGVDVAYELGMFLDHAGCVAGFCIQLKEAVVKHFHEQFDVYHPDALNAMVSLGISYENAGRMAEACEVKEAVLCRRREKLGADHPDVLIAMGNLATFYLRAGRLEEALELQESVLRVCHEKQGADHLDTLGAMNNLAASYLDGDRFDEALGIMEKVLIVRHEKLGADHPDTLMAMCNLAKSYSEVGRRGEALMLNEKVLPLRREKQGPDHPDTLRAMNNLAVSYFLVGREEEALTMREEVLRLRREKLGVNHPDTLMAMSTLACSYSDAGRQEEALALLEEAVRLQRGKLGDDHPHTLHAVGNLADSYSAVGRLEEALGLREEVLRARREKLGADHSQTLGALGDLAHSFTATGRLEEALALRAEVLRIRREKLGEDHPDTVLVW